MFTISLPILNSIEWVSTTLLTILLHVTMMHYKSDSKNFCHCCICFSFLLSPQYMHCLWYTPILVYLLRTCLSNNVKTGIKQRTNQDQYLIVTYPKSIISIWLVINRQQLHLRNKRGDYPKMLITKEIIPLTITGIRS